MYPKLISIASIIILITSCQSYYIPDVYQTEKSSHPDSRVIGPITEKIENIELINFPKSIDITELDENIDVYVGIDNSDGYGKLSKPFKSGQKLFLNPTTNIITYFFESYDSSGGGTRYHYFLVNLPEKSTGKQMIDVLDIEKQTANLIEIVMNTIAYKKTTYGFEWEAVSLEQSLYIHVKMNSRPGTTDVSFLCIDTTDQNNLVNILTDEAIYSDDGYHIVTGYDRDGYNKEGFDKDGKTQEKQIEIAVVDDEKKPSENLIQNDTVGMSKKEVVPISDINNFGQYYALVIGNNNYMNIPKLQTAFNDANKIAQLLNDKYNFHVTLLLDASRDEILLAFNEYRKKLTNKDNLLIYYAGHGWLDEAADEGYWLPVDAYRDNSINWISNNTITSELRAMQAKHVMIISDSCYSGKLTRGLNITNKTPDYLTRMAGKRTRVVMSSGGLEPVMDTSFNKNHSVFASSLIDALENNTEIIDTTTLFSNIRRPVMLNSDQTPEYGDIRKAGHEGGDFIFLPKEAIIE